MLIKKEIKFNGGDLNIKFPIGGSNEYLGYQEEVDEYTKVKSDENITPINDDEIIRFKPSLSNRLYVTFYFSGGTPQYLPLYGAIGITSNDSKNLKPAYLKSFYILDFFDSPKTGEQNLLTRTYMTKLNYGNIPIPQFDTLDISNSSFYDVTKYSQIYYINLPKWFYNKSETIFHVYMRLSFYDAKNGRYHMFYNGDYDVGDLSPNKMYFPVVVSKNGNIYKYNTQSMTTVPRSINAVEIKSEEFIKKYNNTFNKFKNLGQNFPQGNVFDYNVGNYENL